MALFKYLSKRWQHSLINRPETPLLNINIVLWSVCGQIAKFIDRQYFQLYGYIWTTPMQAHDLYAVHQNLPSFVEVGMA